MCKCLLMYSRGGRSKHGRIFWPECNRICAYPYFPRRTVSHAYMHPSARAEVITSCETWVRTCAGVSFGKDIHTASPLAGSYKQGCWLLRECDGYGDTPQTGKHDGYGNVPQIRKSAIDKYRVVSSYERGGGTWLDYCDTSARVSLYEWGRV